QRLADLTGVPVSRVTYQETTALGAALFAGLAAGVYNSVEEAAAQRPSADLLTPSTDTHAREGAYARWLDAVPRVRG
ncbi:MAG: glycerol kinase, partial [Ignavibacteriales bacterium]